MIWEKRPTNCEIDRKSLTPTVLHSEAQGQQHSRATLGKWPTKNSLNPAWVAQALKLDVDVAESKPKGLPFLFCTAGQGFSLVLNN